MTDESLARLYGAAGFAVVSTEGGPWYGASRQIYQSLPPSGSRTPSREELARVLSTRGVIGCQYPNDIGHGLAGGRWVVRDRGYGLGSLQRQFRQHVRRGLERCEVREISFDRLRREAMPINRDAMSRRAAPQRHFLDDELWDRFCGVAGELDGPGVFASFVEGRLAAYFVYVIRGGGAHGLYFLSRRDNGSHRPAHCLYFVATEKLVKRDGVAFVTTGLRSMPDPASIDAFKRHAGYELEPLHVGLALTPAVRTVLCNRVSLGGMRALRRVGLGRRVARIELVARMARRTAE